MLCYRCGSHVPDGSDACGACGQKFASGALRQTTGTFSRKKLAPVAVEGAPFKPGDVLRDRYLIKDPLGAGPLGFVFKAHDREIDVEIALKVISSKLVQTAEERRTFAKEIRLARKLSHSNLVRVYEDGEEQDRPFFTMQFLDGLTLRRIIDLRREKSQFFTLKEIEPIFAQIVAGLEAAHKIAPHGNLKPENVIVLPDLLKLTDFGLAAAVPRQPFGQAQRAKGGVRYLSPEYLSGAEFDARADVYALGVMLGEMVAGVLPDGGNEQPELRAKNPELPVALETVYRRALNENPLARQASPSEFFDELADLVARYAPAAAPQRPAPSVSNLRESRPPPPSHRSRPPPPPQDPVPLAPRAPPPPPVSTPGVAQPLSHAGPAPKAPSPVPVAAPRPHRRRLGSAARKLLALAAAGLVTGLGGGYAYLAWARPPAPKPAPAVPAPPAVAVPAPPSPEVQIVDEAPPAVATAEQRELARAQAEAQVREEAARIARAEKERLRREHEQRLRAEEELAAQERERQQREKERKQQALAKAELAKATTDTDARSAGTSPPPDKTEPAKVEQAALVEPPKTGGCPAGMRLVPAGSFKMGSSRDDPMMGFDEKALTPVTVKAFCVDVYEFPNRAGAAPSAGVTYTAAEAACRGKGKRLCTEEEWERTCKGPTNNRFPYGNQFDAAACNTEDASGEARNVAAAGAFGRCKSGFGVMDLSGNVAEWTSSAYTTEATDRAVKGGAADRPDYDTRCAARRNGAINGRGEKLGFRCCSEPQ